MIIIVIMVAVVGLCSLVGLEEKLLPTLMMAMIIMWCCCNDHLCHHKELCALCTLCMVLL